MDTNMRSYLTRELARLNAERDRPNPGTMPRGQYRGYRVAHLPGGYLRWVSRNWTDQRIREEARAELYRRLNHTPRPTRPGENGTP